MKQKYFLFLLLCLPLVKPAFGFNLKGKVEYAENWQPVIFLASLNSPGDIFVASPDFILSKALIGSDGEFSFDNIELPNEPRFYRLYMVKNEFSSVEFNTLENRNYIHLILDNSSEITIDFTLLNNRLELVNMLGSEINKSVFRFDNEILKHKAELSAELSKAQLDFFKLQHYSFIKNFIENCENSKVGLYALMHIEEKETDFLRNSNFYFSFQKKLNAEFPDASYTESYNELLNSLVGFRDLVCEIPGVAPKWKDYVLIAESILIVFLLIWILLKSSGSKKLVYKKPEDEIFFRLTEKEKQILKLMADGKTNKEISSLLFIELSTVKTHINNIYKQIKVPDRKEAIQFFNRLHS